MPGIEERDSVQWRFHQRADAKRFGSRLANPFVLEKEMRLLGLLGRLDGARVLEVGCGEGSNELVLRQGNPHMSYVGTDFAKEKVAFAQGLGSGGRYVQGDALRLPFRPGSFDVVFLRDVLHHLDAHRAEVLREAMAAARPGGLLVVIEGNVRKIVNRVFSILVRAERGMRNSTPEKFQRLCRRHGATDFAFVEPFFFVRAVNYFLGWPRSATGRALLRPAYGFVAMIERVLAPLCPRENTSYMVAFFHIPGPAAGDSQVEGAL